VTVRAVRFFIGLVILSGVLSCREQQVTPAEARVLLDSLEKKLEWLSYRLSEERWEQCTGGSSDSLEFYTGLYNHVVSDNNMLDRLRRAEPLFSDVVGHRRWGLVYSTLQLAAIEREDNVSALRDSLLARTGESRPEFEGQRRSVDLLERLVQTSGNRSRRELAFRSMHSVGDELADGVARLFRLRNQRARSLGYNHYLAMALDVQGDDLHEYLTLLGQLDSLSLAPYQALLESARNKLDLTSLEIWDLDYANADALAELDRYLPTDSVMLYVGRGLAGVGFELDKLPIYFDVSPSPRVCEELYSVKPPYDVRLVTAVSGGLHGTRRLMHDIGAALHRVHIVEDQPAFTIVQPAPWCEGMARTVTALAEQADWFEAYAHVPAATARSFEEAIRQLNLVALRQNLVDLTFEIEAYTNPHRNLNTLYWDLFERYMLLPRHDDIQPWAAARHYIAGPASAYDRLLAEMIAAQTADFLRSTYGHLVGNPQVGSFLAQNYYRFGSRYDWRELVERGTGKPLNAEPLALAVRP
jgi:peptidyl-dipeptidase A